jgi:hypothetical protein
MAVGKCMTRSLKIFILSIAPLIVSAQFNKIKSIEVSEEISEASIDRAGDLYLITDQGQIQKFSEEGILRGVHKTNPSPTLFEPRDGARLFAFYRDDHTYAYLTPSFEFAKAYKIDSAFVTEPWLACTSGEVNIWCLEGTDGSLKKINTKTGIVEVDVKLSSFSASNISSIREYQGFVFMLEKGTGIVIYNSLGKWIRTIEDKGITAFNFLGEELYYLNNGNLLFFDLFSAETRVMKLPSPCHFAIVSDTHLFMINGKTVDIFTFQP